MNNLFIIVIGIALLTLSCNSQNNEADKSNPNVIDITNVSDSIQNHLQKINYLSLELRMDHPIGKIDKVIVIDTIIFILDKKTNSIFIYSKSGRFINVIAKHGKGPDEFINVMDFNSYDNNLFLLVDRSKLYKYDLMGNWISEIRLKDFYADEFQISEEGILFLSNFSNKHPTKDHYSLRLCSYDGKIRKKFLQYGKEFSVIRMNPTNQCGSLNNSFSVILPPGDVIYEVINKEIKRKISIISNYNTLTSEVIKDENIDNIDNIKKIFKLKDFFILTTFFEMQKIILLQYSVNGDLFTAIFSKEDRTTFAFNNNKFFRKHLSIFPMVVGIYEDSIIGVIPAYALTSIKNHGLTNILDNSLKDIVSITGGLSNPILAFYHYE